MVSVRLVPLEVLGSLLDDGDSGGHLREDNGQYESICPPDGQMGRVFKGDRLNAANECGQRYWLLLAMRVVGGPRASDVPRTVHILSSPGFPSLLPSLCATSNFPSYSAHDHYLLQPFPYWICPALVTRRPYIEVVVEFPNNDLDPPIPPMTI